MLTTGNFRHRHTVVGEISWSDEDNYGPSRRACTASSEEQSASAGHQASAVTDHARASESQWSDVLQHSEQTATCMWLQKSDTAMTGRKGRNGMLCDNAAFWHPGTPTVSPERQSVRMSKITNDGLTLSGTGCFINSCTNVATVSVKGLTVLNLV